MRLGILGGSGLYQLAQLDGAEWRAVDTPWGAPSDELLFGRVGGSELVFLPRHGRGHRLTPSEINYRANIDALKRAGCTDVLSISACGSFKEELAPGSFVLVDQFVDRTRGRAKSFFGEGVVAHVAFADPTCGRLADVVVGAAEAVGIDCRRGGAYLAMEGPQFSTRAESRLYRAAGLDVIGMTNMPEAALAREAELCYLTVAMVTDYDAWHGEREAVDVAQVIQVLQANADNARKLVVEVAKRLPAAREACGHGCDRALEHAILTPSELRPAATVAKLDAVAGRVL
jgi:5'-methylthioadenosine phosphorylase